MIRQSNEELYNKLDMLLQKPGNYFNFEKYLNNLPKNKRYDTKLDIFVSVKNMDIMLVDDELKNKIVNAGDYVYLSYFYITNKRKNNFIINPDQKYIREFLNKKSTILLNQNFHRKTKYCLNDQNKDENLITSYKLFDFEANNYQLISNFIFHDNFVYDEKQIKNAFLTELENFMNVHIVSDLTYAKYSNFHILNTLIKKMIKARYDKKNIFNIMFEYKITLLKQLKYHPAFSKEIFLGTDLNNNLKILDQFSFDSTIKKLINSLNNKWESAVLHSFSFIELYSLTLEQKSMHLDFLNDLIKNEYDALKKLR